MLQLVATSIIGTSRLAWDPRCNGLNTLKDQSMAPPDHLIYIFSQHNCADDSNVPWHFTKILIL